MKRLFLSIIAVFIISSCNNPTSINRSADQEVLDLYQVFWIADTIVAQKMIIGQVRLFLLGRTSGTSVTVQTYRDSTIDNFSLFIDNSLFSDTIPISLATGITAAGFTKSTVIKVYGQNGLIDSFKIKSDTLRYFYPNAWRIDAAL